MKKAEDYYRDPTWLRYNYVEKGETVPDMADDLGVSRSVIRKWMERYGIETTGRGFTPENTDYRDAEWLAFMYHERDHTMQEIADKCDVTVSTIHRWMDKHDIESREKGAHTFDINPMKDAATVAAHPITGAKGEDHPSYKGEEHGWRSREPWTTIRREIIRRDGHECTHCGVNRSDYYVEYGRDLDVHHITPTSEGGRKYDPLNLITLCRECHNDAHTMYYNDSTTAAKSNWVTPETASYA